jgi:hypothetical protein
MFFLRTFVLMIVAFTIIACGNSTPENLLEDASLAKKCDQSNSPESVGLASEERIFSWIADLVGIGFRRTGTPEGYAAAAYVKCQFETLGLEDVGYEYASSWKWEATNASVEVAGQPVDAFPSNFSFVTSGEASSFSTGPSGLEVEIVDVGLGTPLEQQLIGVEGKIVLFDLKFLLPTAGLLALSEFIWDPELTIAEPSLLTANPFVTTYSEVLNAAMDAGAVGFIGVLVDYFESNQYHNEYYRKTDVTIPGFWVSPDEGARIRQLMANAEGTPIAKMVLEGSREAVEARSVIGFLPGKSKDTIMVQSHHDSNTYGAVEDGSGTAAVLAQAQYFASQPDESREKTLMFITMDTHFTGYQAHMAFVDKYIVNKETPYNIVANVTLEHIGKQGLMDADGALVTTELTEIRGIMNTFGPTLKASMINAVVEHDLQRTVLLSAHAMCPVAGMPTDASFVCLNGVPTASLISGPNYLYDIADTLDKVDRDQLVPVTEAFIDIIQAIDLTPSALIGDHIPSVGAALGN